MEKLSMRAKFNGLHNQNGKNYGGEKETTLRLIVVGKPLVPMRVSGPSHCQSLCF